MKIKTDEYFERYITKAKAYRDPHPMLYAVSWEIPGLENPIKFGCAKHLLNRLKSFQTYAPYPLILEVAWPTQKKDPRPEEAEVHRQLASSRLMGEWFRRSDEVMKFIAEQRQRWVEALSNAPSYEALAFERGYKKLDRLSAETWDSLEDRRLRKCAEIFHTHIEPEEQDPLESPGLPNIPQCPSFNMQDPVDVLKAKLYGCEGLKDHDHWLVKKAELIAWGFDDAAVRRLKKHLNWYRLGYGAFATESLYEFAGMECDWEQNLLQGSDEDVA